MTRVFGTVMPDFFEQPILNAPYEYPGQHWELDAAGQPTNAIVGARRFAAFITPIPKPKRQGRAGQTRMVLGDPAGVSTERQEYDPNPVINELRTRLDRWRALPDAQWGVTPETARLLKHWRHHQFAGARPFFCQVEAAETVIWLTEVAPGLGREGQRFLEHLETTNNDANPGLARLALKLATGAGKTTVMAMLIAWQTVNAVRRPTSRRYTRGFLVITPGITIRDRLRVLQPNDPDSYYRTRDLVPVDMLPDLERAKIVITNYHAFKLRETVEVARGTRALIEGWHGDSMQTLETEGQMLRRVMPELMSIKNLMVINDEAHHCYRERPPREDEEDPDADLRGEDRAEAEENKEAARLWISGIEAVTERLGVTRVVDLSATPFFLRGSGYAEGTLFPWTMSDFSLMDAIECGIVKLPRVPVAQNLPSQDEMPMFRNLWEHIRHDMPRQGRGKAGDLDPMSLPTPLKTALEALYGHYAKTFDLWRERQIEVPPCLIIVCQNTAISELVYKYVSGFERKNEDGSTTHQAGALGLFRNFDEYGNPIARPPTLLIDSKELESGEKLDDRFRAIAADEIERFRRERVARGGAHAHEEITDADLLREVMNTVGKPERLGSDIRCVVSVSMLTEGWDANTVTHILGIRAFGTQLLCEQVIGRALRRQSYELNDDGLFNVEYADILGIPFDFTAKPVVAPPQPPRQTVQVRAVSPERDELEIRFPRVEGYRVELPEERLEAAFTPDSVFELTPEVVGPSITHNAGIIGEGVDLNLVHTGDLRMSTLLFHLTKRLLETKWRDPGEEPKLHLFGQLKRIAKEWLGGYLVCKGGTYPAQLMYPELADVACERITAAITRHFMGDRPVKALLDPFNPTASSRHVNFTTSKTDRWQTASDRCHVNWVVLDSGWEGEFCRVAEAHPRVRAYVKNHGLGFEVPYRLRAEKRHYLPDFIVLVEDGHGEDDLLRLVVEIKGYRGEDAKEKKATMETYWVPGVNHLGIYGRWAFVEFTDVYAMQIDFEREVAAQFNRVIEDVTARQPASAAGA
ncbi:MAG: DEAD/DEAH box helicase family protein [Gemmatimonadaceae bacterium]